MGMVFFAGLGAVVASLRMTNIYRSEATIVCREKKEPSSPALSALKGLGGSAMQLAGLGGGGSMDKFEVVLKSRHLSRNIVARYKLMPRLFEDLWNPEDKKWKHNPAPTFQDAHGALMDMMTISRDRKSDVLTIKFDHKDPPFAREMVEHYLTELSECLRKETLKDAGENQRFLRRQLERVSDVLLKEKIYDLLANEIEKETFARAQRFYSFLVLDPPIVPDLNKSVRPKRRLICILSVTIAFIIAIFVAFFLDYISRMRTAENPERLARLRNSLKLKNRGS
jgi:uncharacterized protein involved in exopolysaccharide biosynthesis